MFVCVFVGITSMQLMHSLCRSPNAAPSVIWTGWSQRKVVPAANRLEWFDKGMVPVCSKKYSGPCLVCANGQDPANGSCGHRVRDVVVYIILLSLRYFMLSPQVGGANV